MNTLPLARLTGTHASWVYHNPMMMVLASLAGWFNPVRTLIRGTPWEDVQ